ncbi:hypothetical protein Pmani_026567 [Petrolisthes manimaculis]|uniref:Uncharacterized protein n=1 Tax=Petrolisthes manimaculis TaxID=1843537 RepID=A0AAE1P4E7_9EUCA|nr:hypothetical protein Pmani_026567 [Petrolisthes manimaculis]
MDAVLSDKLSQFFDQMLGDSESVESQNPEANNSKRKSKKKKNKNKYEGKVNQKQEPKISTQKNANGEEKNEVITKTNKSIKVKPDIDTKNKLTEDITSKVETSPDKSERFTKDGFKIISLIPDDDSDVSDAFEYDSEEEDSFNYMDESENKNQTMNSKPKTKGLTKMTEDGFKIVNDIPADDSDVSDAFDDEEEEQEPGLDNHYKDSIKNVKKPILQMIKDFGIDGDILLGKTSKDTMNQLSFKHKLKGSSPNSLTLAAKKRKQSEITILDYTKKRGSDKKKQKKTEEEPTEEENEEFLSQPENSTMDVKLMKRVRYDVFKLGMSGFNKKEKEDARIALAIKLGAKPPKNKAISYKELVEKKKEEKKKFEEEQEDRKLQGLKVTKMKCNKKSERREVVKPSTAQIGHFKNGIQMLSKKDIAKIKHS